MPDRRRLGAGRGSARITLALAVVLGALVVSPAPARPSAVLASAPATVRATALDAPVDMLGLTWPAGDERHVEVRVRHGGEWGPWQALPAHRDEGPDRQSGERAARLASVPLWAGGADGYQLRGDIAGATVHLVRPRRAPRSLLPAPSAASANIAAPPILPRDAWVAREPADAPSYGDEVRMAFVHHTAGASSYRAEEVPDILRSMQAFHMDVNGWDDIGYNLLVDRFGRVWEGRAGGTDAAVIGAHTEGFNATSAGVAVIGTFGDAAPSQEAMDALARVLAWKLPVHGVDPAGRATVVSRGNERHPEGTEATFDAIAGHRDAKPTSCPGAALYSRLGWLRAEASWGAGAVAAYHPGWRNGLFVTTAQLDLDSEPEIVTGPDRGGDPEIRTFDPDGALRSSTSVYPAGFRGGVRVAAGNLDGVGTDEIVVGTGPGGGPDVRVLHEGAVPAVSFLAYPAGFTGGVYVAAGDVDGVPGDEIITGAGPGGGPHVRVFRFDGRPLGSFFAYDSAFRGGVRVAAADLNGDGVDEIVTAPGPGGGPHVRAFRLDGRAVDGFMAYASVFQGGVYVAAVRDAASGADLVVTGAGEGGGPHVRVFGQAGRLHAQFFTGRPSSTTGIRVAGGSYYPDADGNVVLAGGPGANPVVKIARLDGRLVFPG